MDGAGCNVVAVVHGVRGPAVAPQTFRVVVAGHGQVLREERGRVSRGDDGDGGGKAREVRKKKKNIAGKLFSGVRFKK